MHLSKFHIWFLILEPRRIFSSTWTTFLELLYVAHEMCDRWLTWVKQADAIPGEAQRALAERDLRIGRTSAERDPDNSAVAKIFGEDFTNRLVQAL